MPSDDLNFIFVALAVAMLLLLLASAMSGIDLARVVGFMNKKGIHSIRTETSTDEFVKVDDGAKPSPPSVAARSMRTSRNAPSEAAIADGVAVRSGQSEIPMMPAFSARKHAFEDVYRDDIASKPDEYMVFH